MNVRARVCKTRRTTEREKKEEREKFQWKAARKPLLLHEVILGFPSDSLDPVCVCLTLPLPSLERATKSVS